MLVVLDPGFFREDGIDSANPERRKDAEERLLGRLDNANMLLKQEGAALVVAVDALAWFDTVYHREARAIADTAGTSLKRAFDRSIADQHYAT